MNRLKNFLLTCAIVIFAALSFSGCAASRQKLNLALEAENSAIVQKHEQLCKGAPHPAERLKSNPKVGTCPLCQF